jgi:hypothetical protein
VVLTPGIRPEVWKVIGAVAVSTGHESRKLRFKRFYFGAKLCSAEVESRGEALTADIDISRGRDMSR